MSCRVAPQIVFGGLLVVGCLLSACANESTATGTAPTTSADVSPTLTSSSSIADLTEETSQVVYTSRPLDSILARIDAGEDICTLVGPRAVQTSFGETMPLTTQPMMEAKGPACGYLYPRGGGYLLVIQFQNMATWGEYAATGRPVAGLGLDAMYSPASDPQALVVRDIERAVVVRLLAPQGSTSDVQSLLKVAGHIFGTTFDDLRVAPPDSGS